MTRPDLQTIEDAVDGYATLVERRLLAEPERSEPVSSGYAQAISTEGLA